MCHAAHRKAQAGDETAIAALIARLMPLIRKSARQNLAPGLDLEDAVQEGLIGLFEALRRYDADRGAPFVPFAAACIRHAQQDARRAATRKKHAPLNDSVPLPEDEAAPGPEEQLLQKERIQALERALSALSARDRNLVYRKYYYLQSTARMAAELGLTERAVEGKLYRIRRKLQKQLGGDVL